ncbi:unnamed protein product [Lymnaea stagnalis]|uniref:Uncharacterized protein n=1 Tax=Lymnaea stagnalis TaxID=6523 RepID=A0AAV2HZ47_LYMST
MTSFEEIYKGCQTEEEDTLIMESWKDMYKQCTKENNHEEYIKVSEIASRFPQNFREDSDLIYQIKTMADLTVRIEIPLDTKTRRNGTGFVQKIRSQKGNSCPDKTCPMNGSCHKWAIATVTTVYHVINSKDPKKAMQEELADRAVVKVFTGEADGADEDCGKILKGFKLVDSDKEINNFDWCAFECVSHDDDVIFELEASLKIHEDMQRKTYDKYKQEDKRLIVIVGYPHGGPKRMSYCEPKTGHVNRCILKEVRDTQEWCCYSYTAATCRGSSGSPVFILGQPLCGFGYWFGHPHNHSAWRDSEKSSLSSIGVDHLKVDNVGVNNRS